MRLPDYMRQTGPAEHRYTIACSQCHSQKIRATLQEDKSPDSDKKAYFIIKCRSCGYATVGPSKLRPDIAYREAIKRWHH